MFDIFLGLMLGVLGFFMFKAKDHIQHKSFSFHIWWDENNMRFAYCMLFGVLLVITFHFFPESVELVNFLGWNLDGEDFTNFSPVLIGFMLTRWVYSPSKNNPKMAK